MSMRKKIQMNINRRKLEVVFTNERLITPSGLSIVGGLLGRSDFVRHCNRIPLEPKRSEPQIKNGDILLSYLGLLCQGKTEYEAIDEMRDDPDFYKYALGIKRGIPSAETLRQRMDDIGSSLRENILSLKADMFLLTSMSPPLTTQRPKSRAYPEPTRDSTATLPSWPISEPKDSWPTAN